MQTSLQFGGTSTLQEWSHFKGALRKGKHLEKAGCTNSAPESLVFHLTRQLQGNSVIKEGAIDLPLFSESLRQAG